MEKIFRSILVPVDGSPQSKTAQEMAVFISKRFKSQVTVIHVVSNDLPVLAGKTYSSREDFVPVNAATYQFPRTIGITRPRENVYPDEVLNELTERLREDGETILTESIALFTSRGIPVKQKFVEATNTAEAVIEEAEAGRYDLVVIGNSGNVEDELDLHLGSVAKKVALSVKAPILINREKSEVKKILVPVDGSPKEEIALLQASAIAKETGARVIVLHVQEKSLLKVRPEINQIGTKILDNASKMFEGIEVEQKLTSGDPANLIIKTAKQADVDLLVMSGGGLGAFKRLFLGSVTDHVLHHTTAPLLLVK
jgi:nucleotide-binding universal stress UspA family protein